MNPATYAEELAQNRRAYVSLRDQIRRDFAGQYVALAFGRIVAVRANFEDAVAAAEQLQPPPTHLVVFQADDEAPFEPFEASSSAEYV